MYQSLKQSKTLIVLSYLLYVFVYTNDVMAQKVKGGFITGLVMTSDGRPATYSTVKISGNKSARVNKEGRYILEEVPEGMHTVTVSFVGLVDQSKTVTINAGESGAVDFVLSADGKTLDEILIIGQKYAITSKKESEYVARLPLKNLENPQVYSVVDKELIKEQMALTLEESFRNVPGAAPSKTGAGMPSFFSRGFQTSENFRNGMATYLRTGIDLAQVERVETIKGPTSTLFGAQMTSFGGIVNYVTKKPYDTFGGEASYTMGSWDMNRLTADINTPIAAAEGLLFRVNLARQKENTFQDQGNSGTILIAPSLSYQVNDKFKLSLDADFYSVRGITPAGWMIDSKLGKTSFDQLHLDYKQSLNDNSLISRQSSSNILFQADYKLSDKWLSQTKYAWGGGGYDDLYIFDMIWKTDSLVDRTLRVFTDEESARKNFQQNFIGDFYIGQFRNRVVVGLDYMSNYRKTRYDGLGYGKVPGFPPAQLYNLPGTPVIRMEAVSAVLATQNTGQNVTKEASYSAYISDVFNVTDQLSAMASLRVDRFISEGTTNTLTRIQTGKYNQTALSPKFGLVYEVLKEKVSLFANYMNGFKNVPGRIQPDGVYSVFKPQRGNQLEGGLKVELSDVFNATVSYYDIDVTNSLRTETRDKQNYTIQDGTQNSKGFEIELIGKPFRGFNYVASYGYNDNEFVSGTNAGKRAVGTPDHVFNIWASYALTTGQAKGLGLGIGNSYISKAYLDGANTFVLGAYNLLDATVFYNRPKYSIRMKANNLLDEKYWVSDGYYARPQKPFNFMASVAYKF
ncbi:MULTISPECIES: TonB-dependent siderophore receptor [unclassified Sphingobacterium]|uniref:TonB-dependent siderophore receptor n=1 Tax=unclassified Sphingobacterium TaxID=2609468 RepID=UPI0010481D56|nr:MULTISPECIES: TonB-dependent siderophore receptor [unclassified Sphingobacterium]MCS3556576.1 iron complex outermembrane receptor protein [Sphingobacterium sp. JUb21]TCQ99870.1 iron complex outermembrane receptor protein [Sphingobacterium sp. JUb20]